MSVPRRLARRLISLPEGLPDAAQAVVEVTKASNVKLQTAAPTRPGKYSFFRYRDHRVDLFVKTRLKPVTSREQIERLAGQAAGEANCAPRLYPTSNERVLITDYVEAPKVGWQQTRSEDFRQRFAQQLRVFSSLRPSIPRVQGQDTELNQLLGWPYYQKQGLSGRTKSLLPPAALEKRLLWALDRLKADPTPVVFSHYDLTRKNLMYRPGMQLLLIDFDKVGWADPLRGYGQFYGYNNLPAEEVDGVLKLFYQRPPTAAERRRFALWLTVMSIDHYWFKLIENKDHSRAARRKVDHILQLDALLPDMPKLNANPFAA